MDVKELDILGDAIGEHWYYRAKGAAMRRLLAAKPVHHVLDVGAGSGVFARVLLDHGAVEASCVDPAYAREETQDHNGKPIHFMRSISNSAADTVLLMDVLEHVDDDVGLLRDYVQNTAISARFLISVPAFQWLWSEHDVFLDHKRRYTLGQLEDVVRRAGLTPQLGCYYYGLPLPLVVLRRVILPFVFQRKARDGGGAKSDLQMHSALMNTALTMICAVERLFFKANRIGGLSIFCLASRS